MARVWSDPAVSAGSWYSLSLDGGDTFGRPKFSEFKIRLRYAEFDPARGDEPFVHPVLTAGEVPDLFIVQFRAKSAESWRESIELMGGVNYRFLADHAGIWALDPELVPRVRDLPFVRWVGAFHPAYKMEDALLAAWETDLLPSLQRYRIIVGERGPRQKAIVKSRLAAIGATTELSIDEGWVLEAFLTPAQLLQVVHMPEVLGLDRWGAPEVDMNNARAMMGANYLETIEGLTGQGVRAEVCDGGLDTNHADWSGSRAPTIHGSSGSSTSHGTCTFGINFGDGSSNSNARGLMPDGEGVFASYNFSNRYSHTAQCVDPSLPYRVVFQTNSWGNSRTRSYSSYSQEMDDIIRINDLVILQSQSNAGNQDSRPEAWAKNILSVGGIRHQDDQNRSNDSWNYGASIGPAADGRIKPDMASWYDAIWCSDADGGGYVSGDHYTGFGGTSGATPIVAGHMGLLHQMWHEGMFGNPTGADVFESRPHFTTAKALLINSAEQWSFSGSGHDLTRVHQGWGGPDIQRLYDYRDLTFWVDESVPLADQASWSQQLEVPAGEPDFRATLVYVDPAGTTSSSQHRVNDLSLRVTAPDGTVYWGNNGLLSSMWSSPGGSSNTKDTVEQVLLQNPMSGTWTVDVFADEVNADTHEEDGSNPVNADFALVVSPAEGDGGGGTVNSIQLSGPSIAWSGWIAIYDWVNAPPNTIGHLAYASGLGGVTFQGHSFDIDPPISWITVPTGSGGTGSHLVNIPNSAPPGIYYVEMAVFDTGAGVWRDSNPVTTQVY
ncbi:MAG TPA: peptidase S8 [Planctomycetes bacterium]|nr:peptidase S8 [Planctomycetota bacterium]